jgi:hypothetical protein
LGGDEIEAADREFELSCQTLNAAERVFFSAKRRTSRSHVESGLAAAEEAQKEADKVYVGLRV